MIYYNLKLSYEPKVIGVKNGIYQAEIIKEMYSKDDFAKSLSNAGLKSFDNSPDDCGFALHLKWLKTAKKTDFVSFSPHIDDCHFLVSPRTIEVLRSFNIQSYLLIPSVIYFENEMGNENYKTLYCLPQKWDTIDFMNTVFTSGGYGIVPITQLGVVCS